MIASGYSLHLYCEYLDIKQGAVADAFGHLHDEFPHEFSGESRSETSEMARDEGWKIRWTTRQAICPRCNRAGRKFPAS